MSVVIDDRVVVCCPECQEAVPVSIVVSVEGDSGEQVMVADPELSDLWAHMWTHEANE